MLTDTFVEDVRRIGMLLDYGQTVTQIHDALKPVDETEFFLKFKAAQRRNAETSR